ncbi:MAG: M23 family metallopeptidase [Oscillospiraceae bacterium]|nr:M23 family metallopeptidase [Oscillospiraceae bacterium]
MQNNNKPSGFRRFIRDNGYYLVIGVCVLTIGASAYFLLRDAPAAEPLEEVSLNVPVTVEPDESIPAERANTLAEAEDAAVLTEEPLEEAAAIPAEEPAVQADSRLPSLSIPTARTVLAPVAGETLAEYSVSALSYNETTRDWRTHSGIDLAAEAGTAVSAAEAGTVSAVYEDDYFGTTVEISHASGYTTVYANLAAEPCVSVGQSVFAGEEIGAVGTSALLEVGEPPHLHFAVTKNGEPVDPMEYLA